MLNNPLKRHLPFLMALVMVLSFVPVTVLATETEKAPADDTSAVNPAITQAQAEMDVILVKYLGSTTLSFEEAEAIVQAMDWETLQTARYELSMLSESETFRKLTEAELVALCDSNPAIFDFYNLLETYAGSVSMFVTQSGTTYVQIGDATQAIKVEYSSNKSDFGLVSASGTTLEFSARSAMFNAGTTNITITNNIGSKATLSFDYSATGSGLSSLTVDGTSSTSGSYSKLIDAGASISVVLKGTGWAGQDTPYLTMSNMNLVAAAAESTVTLGSFATDLGAASINGGSSGKGSTETAVTLSATPNSGVTLLGWVNTETHELIPNGTYYPTADCTLIPAFASSASKAWFFVGGGTYLYDDLTAAASHASTAANKTVVLAADGTLPALTTADDPNTAIDESVYTIPSGVTLLIPFDSNNTLYKTEPGLFTYDVNSQNFATFGAKAYRTLTMANGANITVHGAISVSAMQSASYGSNGSPIKDYGLIQMNSGSKITVESSGNLYAWGYIIGSGSVEVKNGGAVYECFQIMDFRGGDATSSIVGKDDEYGVFPFNQYYLQNVEVPMTLHAGAEENGFGSFSITWVGNQPIKIPFIGSSDSMFVIDSGYIVKDYIEDTGRTEIKVYGNMTITEVSINMKLGVLGSVTLDTSKYALPIPHHFTVVVESGGITMNQSIAFLPGSEFTVKKDTTCTLGEGQNVYIYDWDQWLYNNGANGYSGTKNSKYVKLHHVPGGNGTIGREKDAKIQIDGYVDTSKGSVYVTSGGANIFSTGTGVLNATPGTESIMYQVTTSGTDISGWPEIAIQPAILQDADGTDVATTEAGTYTYYASTGRWDKPSHFFENGICTVCGIHLFTIEASQIYLGNNLDMGFRFVYNGAQTDDLSGYTVKLTHTGAEDVKVADVTYSFSDWTQGQDDNGTSYYFVVYDGLAARRMCDTITLAVYSGDTPVSDSYNDSMQNYAMRMLNDTTDADAKKRTVLVDMLNYGAEAQVHFEYNPTNLANAGLTETQKAYATANLKNTSVPESNLNFEGSNWLKSNLVTTSNIQFLMAIEGLSLNSTVTVTFTNHRGDSKEITSPVIGKAGDYYYVTIDKLVVADAWCLVTVTVDGVEYTDSIVSYLDRYEGESAVYDAYWKFADSAYAYFHPDK